MKVLVFGLGSMGKRRIRCLQAMGGMEIVGYDPRKDRRDEAAGKYSIPVFDDPDSAWCRLEPEAIVISVPPDKHHLYIDKAIAARTHFFIEASVVDTGLIEAIAELEGTGIVAAPSATLLFHPAIRIIDGIVKSGELGKLSNIMLHSGQYLPDWHVYESPSDFYVSKRDTGGGREIVPFELTWFLRVFGWPRRVAANYRKTIELQGAEYIDDTYNLLLDYGNYLAVLTVDVVSRYATRRLTVNGSKKQLVWSWDKNSVDVYDPLASKWEERSYEMADSAPGYNANIGENMYIDEMRSFFDAIAGRTAFANDLKSDLRVLRLLYAAERSDISARFSVVER